MGHSGKYSISYEDEDDEEVNELTLSLEREEYPLSAEEPPKTMGSPPMRRRRRWRRRRRR
jgi:hypothetical protein